MAVIIKVIMFSSSSGNSWASVRCLCFVRSLVKPSTDYVQHNMQGNAPATYSIHILIKMFRKCSGAHNLYTTLGLIYGSMLMCCFPILHVYLNIQYFLVYIISWIGTVLDIRNGSLTSASLEI